MLFFQLVLLLGYVYAHTLNKLKPRKQAIAHISLLAISLAVLPIVPSPAWKHSATAQPSLTILALLTLTVGLPYFLLSSTSPLLQAWYARTHSEGLPYRLFALSNSVTLRDIQPVSVRLFSGWFLALRSAFPSFPILSERSSPSRVRYAAPNTGAPLTAPGRSGAHP
jgi:membrane-associated HD superfamily phosphohydrolase